ncbi:SubName: Full=Uncharacterized protein {ECO:0000313/EMBL:CCA67329.1} [Serendipita indica DSM 11827]|nr:SubName: Full=Uncharacterized protein {ECO:0000313/EMBL:CCA67329.1} [Serendipita indica DSM 11827]
MVLTTLALVNSLAYLITSNARPLERRITLSPSSNEPNWKSYGCVTDNIAARTLTGATLISDILTTGACQSFCFGKGYKYAGTEWSKECYCDNEFRNGGVPAETGCDMPCSGDSNETCGGGNRLSVYENTGSLSPPETTYPGWSSQGCYTDSVANRALPNQVYVEGDMSVDKCTSKCFSLGYHLAGVEFGRECFCADSIGSSGTPATIGCDIPCTGAGNEICGGGDRLNIYKYTGASVLPSTGFWALEGETGCYTDVVANRALGLRVYVDGPMTVFKCTEKCFSLHYGYAGVEYADECYCSHSIGSSGQPAEDGCTMPCSGDMSTICGGPDRITVYKYRGKEFPAGATVLSSYKDFTSQGCYADSVQARIMTGVAANEEMTVETCIDTCIAAGYEVAGVEYGTECYCSATLPAESNKATDNCIMPCAGDSTHLCGGGNRLNVYRYQVPTTTTTTSASSTETSTSSSTPSISSSWRYAGCVNPQQNSAILSSQRMDSSFRSDTMTMTACRNHCGSIGYEVSAAHGDACWCFEHQMTGFSFSDMCDGVCPGDDSELCGGSSTLASYLIDLLAPTDLSSYAALHLGHRSCDAEYEYKRRDIHWIQHRIYGTAAASVYFRTSGNGGTTTTTSSAPVVTEE